MIDLLIFVVIFSVSVLLSVFPRLFILIYELVSGYSAEKVQDQVDGRLDDDFFR